MCYCGFAQKWVMKRPPWPVPDGFWLGFCSCASLNHHPVPLAAVVCICVVCSRRSPALPLQPSFSSIPWLIAAVVDGGGRGGSQSRGRLFCKFCMNLLRLFCASAWRKSGWFNILPLKSGSKDAYPKHSLVLESGDSAKCSVCCQRGDSDVPFVSSPLRLL